MESNKTLVAPGYTLSLMLFALPLIDTVMGLWPLQLGLERWRYGAIGTLSGLVLLPFIAIGIAMTVATVFEHNRFRRVLGWLCTLFAIILAAAAVLFLLDFFQLRAMVKPQVWAAMDAATTVAVVKQIFGFTALVLLARAGLSAPKKTAAKISAKPAPAAGSPLIPLGTSAKAE